MGDGYATAMQRGLVAHLLGQWGIEQLVNGRVYDEPPESAQRPYVRIGAIVPRKLRTDGKKAATVTYGIEVYSRPKNVGRVEATRIAEAVVHALDEADFGVPGFTLVENQWRTQTVERDSSDQSYQATVAFQAILDG